MTEYILQTAAYEFSFTTDLALDRIRVDRYNRFGKTARSSEWKNISDARDYWNECLVRSNPCKRIK